MQVTAMKTKGFKPIRIEILCESQAEVDALYLLGNTSVNTRSYILQCSNTVVCRATFDDVAAKLYSTMKHYIAEE